jgi:hypothetical protein
MSVDFLLKFENQKISNLRLQSYHNVSRKMKELKNTKKNTIISKQKIIEYRKYNEIFSFNLIILFIYKIKLIYKTLKIKRM